MHRRIEAANRLKGLLGSQLRLQLVKELLAEREGLSVEQAAVRTACPLEDVLACLQPLVAAGVLDALDGGTSYRVRADLAAESKAVIRTAIQKGHALLERQHRVRHELLRGMIGSDPKMQLVTEMVRKVARLDVPVLITGETGTGKELVARAIHELSGRSAHFFGDTNCATLGDALFESHVFGHAQGAFTGAVRATSGLVERADRGTLFLDEIGELGLEGQAKLLKVLQSRTYCRLGETTPRASDFRLVSATNRHLPSRVASGAFREDLYYRINVFPIRLPALRERLDDLPQLVQELVRRRTPGASEMPGPVLTAAALARLRSHRWPGNIRELENVVTRALIASEGQPIDAHHLELTPVGPPQPDLERAEPSRTLAAAERDHVAAVLTSVGGSVARAAQVLDISRTTLYRMMHRHGIRVERTTRVGDDPGPDQ